METPEQKMITKFLSYKEFKRQIYSNYVARTEKPDSFNIFVCRNKKFLREQYDKAIAVIKDGVK